MRYHRKTDPDRHLVRREGIFYYWRRVPRAVARLDAHAVPLIRRSLRTDDLAEARVKRDAHEAADGEYWSALLLGAEDQGHALHRYKAAVRCVEAMGFPYKTSVEISRLPPEMIVQRVNAIMPKSTSALVEEAVIRSTP
jgi:hypothetical protein